MKPPSNDFTLPWVGYLYDLQHRHLPEFFTVQEIAQRNQSFASMLDRAYHVIVKARSVARDVQRFHPGCKAHIHALPFSPCPHKTWLDNDVDGRAQYGIDQPYFMVCNRFWKHKDHGTAFRAFARYLQRGGQALLVCTGQTSDYRFPHYFTELTRLIDELEITRRVRILGHILKVDQIALLKQALAVVQPTLFEGGPGDGASHDAIALGIPVIASDVAVNLEMDCGEVTFFRAGDDVALADALHARGEKTYLRASKELLWQAGLARRQRCGDLLIDIAREATRDQ